VVSSHFSPIRTKMPIAVVNATPSNLHALIPFLSSMPKTRASSASGRTMASASPPQEIDSVGPVPIPGFSSKFGQGPDQTADIGGRNRPFVHKNHAAVRSLFFRPSFKEGRNRPPVIGDKR